MSKIHEVSSTNAQEASSEGQQIEITDHDSIEPIARWRLNIVTFGLCSTLLLSTLETTIVSTALVAITNDLDGFYKRDWIVTSYLLTYTGFLTIFAKFADIFGRKVLLLFSIGIFILFSILCGVSRSINTLIIFRAFQGIGGSGIYSLVSVTAIQITPREQLALYGAVVSVVFVLASALGPLLGGVITTNASWPWVFYLNGPLGIVGLVIIAIFLPSSQSDKEAWALLSRRTPSEAWRRVDVVGACLILAASVLLVFVLEEAGIRYTWHSAVIIACLILSILLWIAFPLWEHFVVDRSSNLQEPIFPIRLLSNRIISAMMLYGFFTGFPFMGVIINLPQRFQAVYEVTPFKAGIYLLPLLLSSPFSAAACGFLTSNLKIPPFYLLVASAGLQILGLALMTIVPSTPLHLPNQIFGYEVILGIGFGLGLTTLLVMIGIVVSEEDKPVMVGAITQIRVLGGTIGLAVLAQILNNSVDARLSTILDPGMVRMIAASASTIEHLSPGEQIAVRMAFAEGYTLLMKVLAGFSGLVLVISAFMWQRDPIRL